MKMTIYLVFLFILFFQKLSIKTVEEVVSDFLTSRTHHKRDEDDHMMPNYLNIKFGGFGEYLKNHFKVQIYKMTHLQNFKLTPPCCLILQHFFLFFLQASSLLECYHLLI